MVTFYLVFILQLNLINMKCKCGSNIPQKRIDLGYKECVNCSTVAPVGCIDIIHHKTGNEIQIASQETAEKMRLLSRRTGFGTLRGMKPGQKSNTYKPKGTSNSATLMARAILPDPEKFEEIGKEALVIFEESGLNKALEFLRKNVESLAITPGQMSRIRIILTALIPTEALKPEVKRNWYAKLEPRHE